MPETQTAAVSTATESSAPGQISEGASELLPDTESLSLDNLDAAPASGQPQATQQTESSQAAVESPDAAATAQQGDPDAIRRAELIAEHAAKLGIKPNDPAFAGVLKQLADKDLYIEKLKGGAEKKPAAAPQLTDYEKRLLGITDPQQQGQPQQQPQTPQVPQQPQPQTAANANANLRLGDAGDQWTKPEDAYASLNEAWTKGDLRQVAEVDNAMFKRRVLEFVPGLVENIVAGILGPEFLQTIPEISGVVQGQQMAEDSKVAVSALKKLPEYADLDKLWEPEGEGEIEAFGERFPNIPLNRIMAKHPWIMDIKPPNDPSLSPRDAQRIARKNQVMAIHTIWRQEQAAKQSLDPSKAQQLVETGRKIEQRNGADSTRQALNAGSGATSASGQPKARSYVQELNARMREHNGLSLDDI